MFNPLIPIEEINILIKDNYTYGLGVVRDSQGDCGNYISEMYQDRINLNLNSDEEMYESLQESKLYSNDFDTLLDGVNHVLDFWFIPRTDSLNILQFKNIYEGVDYLRDKDDKYVMFEIK